MTKDSNDARNLADLEELLMKVRDHEGAVLPSVKVSMNEAVTICQSRHTVAAGINLQLQAALTSIRQGRAEDAIGYIERAIDIERRWARSALQG